LQPFWLNSAPIFTFESQFANVEMQLRGIARAMDFHKQAILHNALFKRAVSTAQPESTM
jgi:hypothetical protein